MFGRRVKKVKSHDDFCVTMTQLMETLKQYVDSGNAPLADIIKYAEMAYGNGTLNDATLEEYLAPHLSPDALDGHLHRLGVLDHYEYEKRRIGHAAKASIARLHEDTLDPFLNGIESIEKNILRNANKQINELNLRYNKIDFIDYEIENSNINEEPYVKVFFTPSEENTSELEIDIRYNEHFVEKLKEREGFNHNYDEDGELLVEDLIEQWFHTAIIVLAANMLKESDLDFFRSVSSDDPGAELIQRLEFDRDAIPEELREKADEFMKYKGIYK